jgi:D-beta-D-heptose 7-phosphate kinase/D-beta-D-heptose 1-phosphate adenosyltransferase
MSCKILVIGDSCIDVFVYGKIDRLCPDAPVPVFLPIEEVKNGGMASNVYNNLLALGAEVDILTNKKLTTKIRYVDKQTNHMIMRLDSDLGKVDRIQGIDKIDFKNYDCVVVSDYNKGFLDYDDIDYICNNHPKVFIDTKKIIKDRFLNSFCIKINEKEYKENVYFGHDIKNTHKNIIITLGSRGCEYKDRIFSVKKVDIKDMSGAGDSFISGLVVAYCKHSNLEDSIDFANACATVVVQKKGVSIVSLKEVQNYK